MKLWTRFKFWYFGVPEVVLTNASLGEEAEPPFYIFERLRQQVEKLGGLPGKITGTFQLGRFGGKEWVFEWKANGRTLRFYRDELGRWSNLSETHPLYECDNPVQCALHGVRV